MQIAGQDAQIRNVRQSIKKGMVMPSEDRRRTGIAPILSVKFNTTLASLGRVFCGGRLYSGKENQLVAES